MAVVEVDKETLWMMDFIGGLGIGHEEYWLHYDSQSSIHLAKNAAYNGKTKHIHHRYHSHRERVEDQDYTIMNIHMEENGQIC